MVENSSEIPAGPSAKEGPIPQQAASDMPSIPSCQNDEHAKTHQVEAASSMAEPDETSPAAEPPEDAIKACGKKIRDALQDMNIQEHAEAVKERMEAAAVTARDKIRPAVETAGEKLQECREKVSGALHDMNVRERAEAVKERVGAAATAATEKLHSCAEGISDKIHEMKAAAEERDRIRELEQQEREARRTEHFAAELRRLHMTNYHDVQAAPAEDPAICTSMPVDAQPAPNQPGDDDIQKQEAPSADVPSLEQLSNDTAPALDAPAELNDALQEGTASPAPEAKPLS